MTQEDKELLLKDLCARLPYGIICRNEESNMDVLPHMLPTNILQLRMLLRDYTIKPYLRPLSSMTEDEEYEYDNLITYECNDEEGICFSINNFDKLLDWFNRKMFDYRGLIEKGLALEAPEGMYETK